MSARGREPASLSEAPQRVRGAWACIALTAVLLCGCETALDRHRRELGELHAQGRYDAAAQAIEKANQERLYGEADELLYHLDSGSAGLATGDRERALKAFTAAEAFMDERRSESAGDVLGSLLINESVATYRGEPYEDIYANVFKMLAQLELGRVQGGATVEARRAAVKANLLRDEYLKLEPAVRGQSKSGEPPRGVISEIASVDAGGEFVESPLGAFLSAVAFMHAGDRNDQLVAGRRLRQAIESQRGIIGPADPARFEGLGERDPKPGDVLFVAFSGRGPRKVPFRLPPLIIAGAPIYLELPVMKWRESVVSRVRVVVDGEATDLDFVESMARVANENHRRQLPLIYTRTFVRTAAKAAAVYFGSKAAERSGGTGAQIGVLLGGLALMVLTEHADLRCWELLPGQAHARVATLSPGEHSVRVEWLSAGGGVVHATPPTKLTIEPSPNREPTLRTIVEYYWE